VKKIILAVIILLLLHFFFLANLRFTVWPEILSYPYLFNQGFSLYKDFIYPYPPLLVLVLAFLFKVFDYHLLVVQLTTWAIILIGDLLIFKIIKMVTQRNRFAFLGLLFYVSLQPFLEGNMLWFDLAIVTPLLAGTYYLIQKQLSIKNIFWVGFWFAVACLVKQTSVLFLGAAFVWLMLQKIEFKKIIWFWVSPAMLAMALGGFLFVQGWEKDFLNWTLIYPLTFWGKFPGYVQMALTKRQFMTVILLFAPIIYILIKKGKNLMAERHTQLLFILLTASLLLIYPRFSFFHSQTALAFLSILTGVMLSMSRSFPLVLAIFYLPLIILVHRNAIMLDWGKEARFLGSGDLKRARIVSSQVSPNERVFFLGLPSSLYALSGRIPPKPWTDIFGWYLEIPGVQEEILNRWENEKPKYIYWQLPRDGNWFDLASYQPQKITKWVEDNYTEKTEPFPGVILWEKK
jgi:hypothetical protein